MIAGKVIDWFIRDIIMPQYEKIQDPGFIVVNFKNKGQEIYIRQLLFPESLLCVIEDSMSKSGETQVLYDTGVTLGFIFAKWFNVPVKGKDSLEEIEKYLKFTLKWNFATWSSEFNLTDLDLQQNHFRCQIKDHIICRLNGKGYILTEGAESGFAKYMLNELNIEAVQIKCQGRGDPYCETVIGYSEIVDEKQFKKGNITHGIIDFQDEKKFNAIKPLRYARTSAHNLIKNGVLKWNKSHLEYKGEGLFECSVLLYYLLELNLQKTTNGSKVLYESGFIYGQRMGMNENLGFISELLSALGWGDALITKKDSKILVDILSFPWCSVWSKNMDFFLFRGFLSGMLSEVLHRDIKMVNVEARLTEDGFQLTLIEDDIIGS